RLHLQEGEQRMHLLLHGLEADEAVELRLQLGQRARRRGSRAEAEQVLELRPGGAAQLVAELACGAAEILRRIRRHGPASPKSAFFEHPPELGYLLLEPGDALFERTRPFRRSLCDCHTFDVRQTRRVRLAVPAEELAPAVLALPRAARQLLRQL